MAGYNCLERLSCTMVTWACTLLCMQHLCIDFDIVAVKSDLYESCRRHCVLAIFDMCGVVQSRTSDVLSI